MIRIDQLWLCTAPMDMRAGAERLMSCVVQTTGAARAHHGYIFANARATRIKLLVHGGFGVWCAARRLNAGHFAWPREAAASPLSLTQSQFDARKLSHWGCGRPPAPRCSHGCLDLRDSADLVVRFHTSSLNFALV